MQHSNPRFIHLAHIWQTEELSLHFSPFSLSFIPLLTATFLPSIYLVSRISPTRARSFLLLPSDGLPSAGVGKPFQMSSAALTGWPSSGGWLAPLSPGSQICPVQLIFPVICSKACAEPPPAQAYAKCWGLEELSPSSCLSTIHS